MPSGAAVIRYEGTRGVTWRVKYRDADGRQVKETVGREADGITRKHSEAALRERLVKVETRGGASRPPTMFRDSQRPASERRARRSSTESSSARPISSSSRRRRPRSRAIHQAARSGPPPAGSDGGHPSSGGRAKGSGPRRPRRRAFSREVASLVMRGQALLRAPLTFTVAAAVALALAGIGSSTPPGRNGLIAFAFDGRGAGTALRGKPAGIAVVRPDGGEARLLIRNGRSPAWSPDGRRLAFIRSGNVFVVNADGRGVQRLTRRGMDDTPAWSPDGRRIAFIRTIGQGESQRNAVMVMNTDGHHKRAVYFSWNPNAVDALEGPSWSPDGSLIAFSDISGQFGRILIVAQVGGRAGDEWSPATGDLDDYDPDWSPDGAYLAFTRTDWLLCGECDTVALARTDGGGFTRQLIDEASNPSWAPDGQSIVAESPDGLIIIDLLGNRRALFPYAGTEPAWQPLPS